jgi:hypothetical protein
MWPSYGKVNRLQSSVKVYKNFLTIDETERRELKKFAQGGQIVFNPDKLRLQRSLPNSSNIRKQLVEKLETHDLLKDYSVGGVVVIHSKEGCKQQDWHYDYDPDDVMQAKTKPLGVLLALQANTKFCTLDKVYHLNKGDLITFTGDTIHAGSAYEKSNTRIHMYLDVPDVRRRRNSTYYALLK